MNYKYRFFFVFVLYLTARLVSAQVLKSDEEIARYLSQSELKLKEGDKKEGSRWLNEAATAHWERKEYPKALDYFKKSLKINEELGNESGMAMLHNNMGMIYADLREYETSLFNFQKCLEIRRVFKDKVAIQSGLINTAVVLNNLQRYQESIRNLKEALDIAREMNDPAQMRSCYGMLAETYEKAGDVSNTLLYFNLYRSFHELVQRNKVQKIEKTLEEKQVEMLRLENEKQRQELELLRQSQELMAKDNLLDDLDKEYQDLYMKSTKKDIMMELMKNKDKLEQERLNEELIKEKHKEQIYLLVAIVAIIFVISLIVLSVFFYRSIKYKEKMNTLLQERNNEIIRQKEEIELQKETLNETNKLKDKLFSVLAHDLRSPFATLESLMMLYEFEEYDQQQTKEFLLQIRSLSNSTLQTLENTLDWVKSQMNTGYKYEPRPLKLYTLTQEVIEFLSEIAKSKKIEIKNNIFQALEAYADINQIRIVIRNLISNAIKFTHEGGRVTIAAEITPESKIAISVEDTGVGIPENKIIKLFNTSTHFTTQGTKHEKGTGLGLLLTKELVEKNNGKITVNSVLNEGTTFTFTLNTVPKLGAGS